MRLLTLLFTGFLAAAPAQAQTPKPSSPPDSPQETVSSDEHALGLPVSLDKIKEALEQTPVINFRALDERPTFRVQIRERRRIEELLAMLNYKTTPAPAGGLYGYEMQRQMWPSVDNPLRQPYAALRSDPKIFGTSAGNQSRIPFGTSSSRISFPRLPINR